MLDDENILWPSDIGRVQKKGWRHVLANHMNSTKLKDKSKFPPNYDISEAIFATITSGITIADDADETIKMLAVSSFKVFVVTRRPNSKSKKQLITAYPIYEPKGVLHVKSRRTR